METSIKTLTLVFFSITSLTSEAYTSNDFTATCRIITFKKRVETVLETNCDRSLIRYMYTFPYLPEPTAGHGMVMDLGDIPCEILEQDTPIGLGLHQ
jgi:hypothetical protein